MTSSVFNRACLLATVLAAAAGLALATPASAGPLSSSGTTDSSTTPIVGYHPELDHAGSEVAKHEGVSGLTPIPGIQETLAGIDVSHYQGNIDWNGVVAGGAKFAYMKATEGTDYQDSAFSANYTGSYNAGLIRGAYHFALPNTSSPEAQADFFVAHGGGWSADGKTLPPMMDMEYNPYGDSCYGMSQQALRDWIAGFSNRVHASTGRYPTIYTAQNWWSPCTGDWDGLGGTNPLFVARYSSDPGTLPAGWGTWTFWQYSDSGSLPGDQDYFNGAQDRLQALANG